MKNKALKVVVLLFALIIVFALPMSAEEYLTGDMNGDGVIDSDDAIYLLRHTLSKDNYPLACNHKNVDDKCALCGVELPKTTCPDDNHDFEFVGAQAPTCTNIGWNAYTKCKKCDYIEGYVEKPSLGHETILVEEKASNCTEVGWLQHIACTRCDYKVGYQEIPTLGHKYINGECVSCGDRYSVDLDFTSNGDGTCYVSGIGTCTDKEIIIPEISPDGDIVTGIGDEAFINCDSLTSVTIPGSVTSIGSEAFVWCSSLTSVTIPDSVTSIGSYAFYDCNKLTSVTIPDIVTIIGDHAFENCTSLTSVHITDIAAWCNISFGDYYANPLYYAENLYLNGELVTDIIIPDSVTSIGDSAFSSCTSLTSVTIPDSVTSIGNYAFYNCTSLTSVTIPGSVTSIGDGAFMGCDMTSVTIPGSVTSIGSEAFGYCYKLVEVINKSGLNITKGSTSNGYVAYYALEVHEVESKIVNKDGYLFYTYDNVNYLFGYVGNDAELVLPDSYNGQNYVIHNHAFYFCDRLTSVTIPGSVTSIGDFAFGDCDSLTSVTIPDSVTSIGNYAFAWCYSLTSVTIGDSVTSIGSYAFASCYSLTSVTIPDSVTSIGNYAFEYCTSLTSVTIPDSVTSIGDYAFVWCSSLTSVTIPDSVTSIGNYAFAWCYSLTSVTIPGSVTSIGDVAFGGCTRLTNIVFEDTSTWYRTTDSSDWQNMTGGTETDVTNSSTNATYFESTYYDYYWYKK